MAFLEEATTMDPRFKERINKEEVFDRLMEVAVKEVSQKSSQVNFENICNAHNKFIKAI